MIRIATVGYLNAAPLVAGLDHERYAVSADIPSRVAKALSRGEADVALTPVVSALDDGDFRIVGGVAIGSEGPVHSVVLVAESEPEEWSEIVLDGESRTSAILTQVLLKGPLAKRCTASVRSVEPGVGVESARGTTAALVIGDAAMMLPDRLKVRLDLGEIWTEWTGLPFVFAVWAGRPDLPGSVREDLQASAAIGLEGIKTRYEGAERDYLENNIRYLLDDRALMGLRRFAALAHGLGLLGSRDVRLYGPTETTHDRGDEVDHALERAANGEGLSDDELSLCARYGRLSDLAAAASLRSSAPEFPTATLGQRLRLDARPGEVAEQLHKAREHNVEVLIVEGLDAVSFEEASARLEGLGAHNSFVLSLLGDSSFELIKESWKISSQELTDWLVRHNMHHVLDVELGWSEPTVVERSELSLGTRLAIYPSEDPAAILDKLTLIRRWSSESQCRIQVTLEPGEFESRRVSAVEGLRALCLCRLGLPGDVGLSMSSEGWGGAVAVSALRMGATELGVLVTSADGKLADSELVSEHLIRLRRELDANGFTDLSGKSTGRRNARASSV